MLNEVSLAQKNSMDMPIYNWSDSIIGQQNSGLFNGFVYVEKHKMINDRHKFFKDFNFSVGKVIYDNKPFDKILLKYNIYEDQLILKHSFAPNDPTVLIDKKRIVEFSLLDHHFVNLNIEIEKGKSIAGFFERLININELQVLKKYQKRIRNRTNEKIQYQEFTDDNQYYVKVDETYVPIKNPKKLSKQFSSYKEIINSILLDDEAINKSSYEEYLIKVFTAIAKNKKPVNTKS